MQGPIISVINYQNLFSFTKKRDCIEMAHPTRAKLPAIKDTIILLAEQSTTCKEIGIFLLVIFIFFLVVFLVTKYQYIEESTYFSNQN